MMQRHSILFPPNLHYQEMVTSNLPDFFLDLNLDQVIDAITAYKQEYNLKPFFYNSFLDLNTISYRQAIFRDLESANTLASIKKFSDKIIVVKRIMNMVNKLYYKHHRTGWMLEAALTYSEAVVELANQLSQLKLNSEGLQAFRNFLNAYVQSSHFISFSKSAIKIKEKLSNIRYNILIKGKWIKVRQYDGEVDYGNEVAKTFEKFKQGEVKSYRIDLPAASGMNHIEAQILDCVAKLFPDIFQELEAFYLQYQDFFDETIKNFDREIQFYIAYLDFISTIKTLGLSFCYPQLSTKKEIKATEAYDIALAYKRINEKTQIVPNDFYLEGSERIMVITGPNQGGKTTFARMFGQLHYLACLGLPVPAKSARLFLCDNIFTHFEREENFSNLRGKLQDDLFRIKTILGKATTNSLLILNEIFTSTALKDAISLSKKILYKIIDLDCLCVFVTFLEECSTLCEKTISMVSTIEPNNPTIRTYKIIRKPADGLSYAISIAEKYHLTYPQIIERLKS